MTEAKKAAGKKLKKNAQKPKSKKGSAETIKQENVTAAAIDAAEQAENVAGEKQTTEPVAVAKAGKRSTKAIKEAEEKQAKEERKAASKDAEPADKPKLAIKPTRSRLERRGKKYREAAKSIDQSRQYPLKDALDLATKTNPVKFDAAVELHVRLNVDPKQADQNIRDSLVLPAGTGKTLRVAVFAEEDIAKAALKAGADIAGADDFLARLDKGTIDFDILIATPGVMARLSKYARVLGPKGLMPNPKSGTVTKDVNKAISEAKAGKVEYRVDSTGIVHAAIGKVSFGADKLGQNASALFESIKSNKPSSLKGTYVRSITVTTSMGPAIKIAATEL